MPSEGARPPRPARRLLIALCVTALIAALGYGGWSWRQHTRPGMTHYMRGMSNAAGRHFHEAEREWQTGVREDPTFPGCYERLGDLYQEVHNYPKAITNYTAAIKLRPNDGSLYKRLAGAYREQGNDRAALPAAKRAYELLPQDAAAAGAYGDLAQRRNDRRTALAALQRAHQLDPSNSRYLVGLASVEMDLLLMQAAEQDLNTELRNNPNNSLACYFMAVVYNRKPHTPENLHTALAYAERSASSTAPPPVVFPLLARLYLSSNRPADALRTCQYVLQRAPNNMNVLSELVGCYTRLGRPEIAAKLSLRVSEVAQRQDRIGHLQEVMAFNHSNVSAGLELARLEEQEGDTKMALTYYVTMVRQAPNDPRTRPALAAFLRRTGHPEMANQAGQPDFVP